MLKITTRIGLFLLLLAIGADFGRNQARAAPTAANLIAHWEFEGNANDSSGNNYHPSFLSAVVSAEKAPAAPGAWSYEFSGNHYIDTAAFDINNDFSIAAWVNPDNMINRNVVGKHTSGGGNQILFGFYGDGFQVRIHDDAYEAGPFASGWQHILAVGRETAAGTDVTLYRNGIEVWQHELTTKVGDVSGGRPWTIGQDWDTNTRTDLFDGHIDDVRIYDSALSASEIATLTAGFANNCTVPGSHATVPAAVNDANCDSIDIAAGTYNVNTSITRNLVIRGAGEADTILTVPADGNRRVFSNSAGHSVTMQDLTISGGHSGSTNDHGTGIYNGNGGELTLERVTLSDNSTAGYGGSIFSLGSGSVELINSTVELSHAGYGGGGIYIGQAGVLTLTNTTVMSNTAPRGAGIYLSNDGNSCSGYADVSIDGSVISNNTASSSYSSAGGGLYGSGTACGRQAAQSTSSVQITNSSFSENNADYGGAISVRFGIDLHDVSFSDNSAFYGGAINLREEWDGAGKINISDSTFRRNQANVDIDTSGESGFGGAIYNEGGEVIIEDSEFIANTTEWIGGAILQLGGATTTITGTLFDQNDARISGGALFNTGTSTLNVADSYFQLNTADRELGGNEGGGAILNFGSHLTVQRSSFQSNSTNGNGGALFHKGTGGSVTLENSTISGNVAPSGGGITMWDNTDALNIHHSTIADNRSNSSWASGLHIYRGAQVKLSHTIISNNAGSAECETNLNGAQVISQGYNIASDNSCNLNAVSDQPNTDPLLDTFQIYEGSQWGVFPLLDGSPALDGGSQDATVCTGVDGRNAPRFASVTPIGACDIGAVEVVEATLYGFATPWERYFDWVQSNLFLPGQTFRNSELTRPAEDKVTTIDSLEDNFATLNEGRLFYRYCADDHATIVAGTSCRAWDNVNLSGNGHDIANLNQDSQSGEAVAVDIQNMLLAAIDEYQFIATGPMRDITVNIGGEVVTTSVQTVAAMASSDAVLEMVYIPQIYGAEFMVDALRYSFGPAQLLGVLSGAEMIQGEIDQLELAHQQFANAANMLLWAQDQGFASELTSAEFETFAIASQRQIEATLEIVKRRRLLGDSPFSLLVTINEAYASQYLQANLLAKAIKDAGLARSNSEAQAIFLENGGWLVMNNLEALQQLAESIRNDTSLIGFDKNYVPRSPLDTLLTRMGEIGSCGVDVDGNPIVTGGNGELLAMQQSECAAGAADRNFDQDAGDLDDEISALEADFRDELQAICGGDTSSPDWNAQLCVEGEMGSNYSELEGAQKAVGLAWQRAQNIPEMIRIEQERAGTIITMIMQTGEQLQALEHSIGMLSAYREVTTSSTTTEVWAPGSDPNDPTSGAYWLDFGKDGLNCLLSGATAGALGDGCQGNNDNLFGAIGAIAGIETEPSAIETVDTISDPNEYEIGVHKGTKAIREATRDATIEGANSNAEIKRLLLEQADLLIEYEIAVDELNRVISERNLLIQRHRRALNEHRRVEGRIADDFLARPDYRILRDQTANNAELARERAVQLTYLTIKALEYELLAEPLATGNCGSDISAETPLLNALYLARTAKHLDDILCEIETITLPLEVSTGNRYPVQISVARDIWGLTDDNLLELLPYTPDPSSTTWPTDAPGCGPLPLAPISDLDTLRFCLFQERLHISIYDNATVRELADSDNLPSSGESIYFNFGSQLEQDVELDDYGRWNIRIADDAMCGSGQQCGVAVNVQTKQAYSGNPISVFLTHQGQATYRTASGGVTAYNPGLTALIGQTIPDGWPSGSAVNAAITAGVNGSGGLLNRDLTNLSAATTDWRFRLQLSGSGSQLDRYQLEDFVISMDTVALTVNSRRAEEISAEIATLQSQNQAIPAELLTERDYVDTQLARENAAESHSSRAVTSDVTPPSVLSDDVIGGTYNGNVIVQEPVPLGIFDMGLTITRTGTSITGNLCGECTPLYDSAAVSGIFTSTGTMTDTFSLQSVPFTQIIDGKTITRSISMVGIVYRDGDVMEGTYRELIEGYGDEPMMVEGTYIANRPMQFYDFSTLSVPTAVGVVTGSTIAGNGAAVMIAALLIVLTLPIIGWRRMR